MENQNSPQQQAADLRMMLDNEPPEKRSSRRSSRGTTLSDIDTMSYDELVAYISDSNSDFADDGAEFDGQNSLYGSRGSDNYSAQPSQNILSSSKVVFEPQNLADELREEEERAKRAVPYSFASLGKKQPSNNSATDSRLAALSAMRTTTPDPQEYPESKQYQQYAAQDQDQEHAQLQEENVGNASSSTDFVDGNFDADGYDAEGFDRDGFDRDGFDRDGFDKDNYDRDGYDWEGYDCEGFDRDGFDRDGFDRDNYDRDGYDWEGYDWEGFDRDGFDRDGFDRDNYDRDGYDWEGYNQYGLDRQGFNRDGFDSEGYDREGFNAEGFDREGFDRDGFDQYNYNREGYDWEGYDCEGYDYGGFDREGYDKEGYTRQDWENAGYKFGPRGEFILTENEQQNLEADTPNSIPEEDKNAQTNEQVKSSEQVEELEPEANSGQAIAEQDENDKIETAEDELPEYNFAAAPPTAHNKAELATVKDSVTEEEEEEEENAPQQTVAEQNLVHEDQQQPYEQEYAHEDLAHEDEQQPYEQEYAHEDLVHEDEQQPYEQEYAHEDLVHEDEQQPYEQEYAHEDLAHEDEQQPYEQEYAHEDLVHEDEQQPYEQEYAHEDLAHNDEPQPAMSALQDKPRADVPLFEPEDKFGNMTSPWRYECDYAIDYVSGSRRGQRIALLASELGDERTFTIGSRGERVNDIEVDEPTIANDQALLRYGNGRFTLINFQEDIKINKRIVTCGEQVNLMTGDEIALGNTTLVFSERCVSEALAEYSIDVVEGTETDLGKSFPLTKQRSSVGRDRNSDIPLTDQEISRHHCTLIFRAGKFFLQHRSDTNPTFINGVSVPAGGERQITTEDKIQISSRTVLQLVKH